MLWNHTAYCRACRKRVYVQPRYYSTADDVFMTMITCGIYSLMKWLYPVRFGRWQCDECGSQRCVAIRAVKEKQHKHAHSRRRSSRRRRSRS